ncbi:hypothetical protein BH11PSE12_BH11PSE12_30820 [soil metagenome]
MISIPIKGHKDIYQMSIKYIVGLALFSLYECSFAQTGKPLEGDSSISPDLPITISAVSNLTGNGKTFLAMTTINAPLEKICSTIVDYSNYPQFMPNTEAIKLLESKSDYELIEIHLRFRMGITKKYRLKMALQTNKMSCKLSWKMIPWNEVLPSETIADTFGYWQLTPDFNNEHKTLVNYYVYVDPGFVPFGLRWFVDFMAKTSLPDILDAVRKRASKK